MSNHVHNNMLDRKKTTDHFPRPRPGDPQHAKLTTRKQRRGRKPPKWARLKLQKFAWRSELYMVHGANGNYEASSSPSLNHARDNSQVSSQMGLTPLGTLMQLSVSSSHEAPNCTARSRKSLSESIHKPHPLEMHKHKRPTSTQRRPTPQRKNRRQ
jgi:hypothetical protein